MNTRSPASTHHPGRTALLAVACVVVAIVTLMTIRWALAQESGQWAVFEGDGLGDRWNLGLLVAPLDGLDEIVICGLIGGGLCEGDHADETIADVGSPPIILGPFNSRTEAIRAFCDSMIPDTGRALPLAAGYVAQFAFDGEEHRIDNAPSCDYIPEEETPTAGDGETPEPSEEPTSTPEPGQCFVRGTVTDGFGHPLVGARIRLTYGASEEYTSTDASGRYEFDQVSSEPTPEFDPEFDRFQVELRLRETDHDPSRFEVWVAQRATSLLSDAFEITPQEDCQRDFDLAALPDDYIGAWPGKKFWPDIAEIYDRTSRAWALVDLLGEQSDYGLPLPVLTYCGSADWNCTDPPFAFFQGSLSNGLHVTNQPYIAMSNGVSSLSDRGWPDNREYHEFGHYFMTDMFNNAMPDLPGDRNHDGYYKNPSSNDSWTEGFAEFFSMMVSKHIDGEPLPYLYRLAGAQVNLELDMRAWYGLGWGEEMAIAGLLLDLEDGPADYAQGRERPDVRVDWFTVVDDPVSGRLLVGEVVNNSPDDVEASEQTMVSALFLDGEGNTVHLGGAATVPWDIPNGGGRGFFAVAIPEGLQWDSIQAGAFEGRPGDVLTDDDPIDLTLEEVWSTIVSYLSQQPDSNGYLFDATDLHAAFKDAYGGRDGDGNGMDDIDQVFIAHGLFADENGDRSYARDEVVGRSDHPAFGPFPSMVPRRDAVPLPGGLAQVDTGDVDAAVQVEISLPSPNQYHSYSYTAMPDEDGRVFVFMPPPEYGGTATLTALADGYLPKKIGEIEVESFWEQVDASDGEPFLSFEATLKEGEIGPDDGGSSASWPLFAGGGLALVAVAGFGLRVTRRREEG